METDPWSDVGTSKLPLIIARSNPTRNTPAITQRAAMRCRAASRHVTAAAASGASHIAPKNSAAHSPRAPSIRAGDSHARQCRAASRTAMSEPTDSADSAMNASSGSSVNATNGRRDAKERSSGRASISRTNASSGPTRSAASPSDCAGGIPAARSSAMTSAWCARSSCTARRACRGATPARSSRSVRASRRASFMARSPRAPSPRPWRSAATAVSDRAIGGALRR